MVWKGGGVAAVVADEVEVVAVVVVMATVGKKERRENREGFRAPTILLLDVTIPMIHREHRAAVGCQPDAALTIVTKEFLCFDGYASIHDNECGPAA